MSNLPHVKILLVDDKEANLTTLEAVLGESDYTLIRALSGTQAIELVQKHDFAAILLDVQMPVLDGYETAKRIKSLPRGKNVPIIFVTAVYKEDEDVQKGYAAGGMDYFGKPFVPSALKAKVGIYVDLFRKSHRLSNLERLLAEVRDRLATEKTLGTVFDIIPDAVIAVDGDGHITQANREAVRVLGGNGLPAIGDIHGVAAWWTDSGRKLREDEWPLSRALEQGETVKNEMVNLQSQDGTKKTVLLSASPLWDGSGSIIGAVGVMKEIAHNKHAHA